MTPAKKTSTGSQSSSGKSQPPRETKRVVHALDFLDNPESSVAASITLLVGNESFLKRLAVDQITASYPQDDGQPHETLDGAQLEWRDLTSQLSTGSLFCPDQPRLIIVENADRLVSAYRAKLERYLDEPCGATHLLLLLDTLPSNTRIYQIAAAKHRIIQCSTPTGWGGRGVDTARIARWLRVRATKTHRVELDPKAAEILLDRIGPQFGLLDQEVARLAVLRLPETYLSVEFVETHVGTWRMRTGWELIDAMLRGDAPKALEMLGRLLDSGESDPNLVFGQISWALRQYAAATRIVQRAERAGQRPDIVAALAAASVRDIPRGNLQQAAACLRQIGRRRASRLYRWLLETDLALKGSHSQPHRARFALEHLILKLARWPESTEPRVSRPPDAPTPL